MLKLDDPCEARRAKLYDFLLYQTEVSVAVDKENQDAFPRTLFSNPPGQFCSL